MDLSKAVWRKASRSTAEGDNCVEVALISQTVALRDSKDPDGPKLIISHSDFRNFASALQKSRVQH
ncbi:DUF397 domain-containing protein [Actinomadura sp. 6K520]|jgi:hypothetical protein|uniref:DUF397 domain-containing protein n=1 Tax=Actinomadura sp. 6K520 TaxID=2530364 RepID=UPI001053A844|nr:DUF397 domain-containing protein [Actinomadura sp. 6K520]TDE26347.1 DUF397 domain-containing protein [Actinomadura sp. 6K520]